MAKVFVQDEKVYSLCVDSTRRSTDVVEDIIGVLEEEADIIGLIEVCDGAGGSILGGDMGGFLYIGGVSPTDPLSDTVVVDLYQDAPNNTVPQEITVSNLQNDILVRASYPIVLFDPDGTPQTLTLTQLASGIYEGTFTLTLAEGDNVFQVQTPDNDAGPEDTIAVTLSAPPVITSLQFTGPYPTTFSQLQTELKSGDNFSIEVDTDKSVDLVEIVDFGVGSAAVAASIPVGPTTPGVPFTVQMTAADRGDVAQQLPARIRVRDATTGAFSSELDTNNGGGSTDGVDVVTLNDLRSSGTITSNLPGSQGAVKLGDVVDIDLTANDFSDFLITSPTGDFTFPLDTTFEANKVLGLVFAPATLNESNDNINMRLRRFENGSEVNVTELILVQDAIPNVSALLPGGVPRLISATGAGENHTITLSSNQLVSTTVTPTMDPAASRGTFTSAFVDSGNGRDFTATLQVPDADNPADDSLNAWQNIQVTNRAGRVATSLIAGANYIIGGFAPRDIAIPAQSPTVTLSLPIVQYAKVQAGVWEISQVQSVKAATQGDTTPLTNGYTVDVDNTTLRLLDQSIIDGNTGLEILNDFEETP